MCVFFGLVGGKQRDPTKALNKRADSGGECNPALGDSALGQFEVLKSRGLGGEGA